MSGVAPRAGLDIARLRECLASPDCLLRSVEVVAETGSTNGDLLVRARSGEDVAGVVLIAEHQTAARGRHGRAWSAPPRSQVAFSLGVDASSVPTGEWGWLPLVVGMAVVEAISAQTSVRPSLKWPNDVMVHDRKLAGILAEVAAPSQTIVVGVGVNVTLTAEEAPSPSATSLTLQGAGIVDRTALASGIVREVARRGRQWQAVGGVDRRIVDDYNRLCTTLGMPVRASLPGDQQIVGVANAVDQSGRLRISTADGLTTVSAGDVVHLRAQ
jgi:BirA family biotin operon repressor/biotin-[acetyl-CoA-carboxylase] ligase